MVVEEVAAVVKMKKKKYSNSFTEDKNTIVLPNVKMSGT